jgi:AcrR family transcriptional regulator
MAAKSARGRIGARVVPAKRLARAQRREDLLDAAVKLILSGGVEAVSMETVADRASVSQLLVYKHFASKNELLTRVYRREALAIYDEVAADVRAATRLPERVAYALHWRRGGRAAPHSAPLPRCGSPAPTGHRRRVARGGRCVCRDRSNGLAARHRRTRCPRARARAPAAPACKRPRRRGLRAPAPGPARSSRALPSPPAARPVCNRAQTPGAAVTPSRAHS